MDESYDEGVWGNVWLYVIEMSSYVWVIEEVVMVVGFIKMIVVGV